MKGQNETFFPKQNPEAASPTWSDPCPIYMASSAPA